MPSIPLRDAVVSLLDSCCRTGGVLGYHAVVDGDVPSRAMHVDVATLSAQLEYIAGRYDVIPLRELVARRAEGRSIDRCIAITFDDAYVGVEQLAAPMLSRLNLPATVFVTVAAAETGGVYWWDQLEDARLAKPYERWESILRALGIPSLPPHASSRDIVRDHLIARHAGRLPPSTSGTGAPLSDLLHSMDFDGLRRLVRDPRFDFGCHTLTHPALPFLSADEQEREMEVAQRRIQDELERVVPILAYPFGLYDGVTIAAARRAGMQAAVTMQPRALSRGDAALTIPRIGVSEDWSVRSISLRVNAALRRLFIHRDGGIHPRMPIDPVPA